MTLTAKDDIAKWCEKCSWGRIAGVAPCTSCHITPDLPEPTSWRPILPPLTALGPDSTDLTGAADLGASSVDLKALSDMISVGLDMTEVLQMNLEDPSHAHDLTKGLVEQFQGIQALLGDKASTRMVKGDA